MPIDWRGYQVKCQTNGCETPAIYKVAATWSDGHTTELKTYALCCSNCLAYWYQQACRKQASCRLAAGETLEVPGIYELAPHQRDRDLQRRHDLETACRCALTPAADHLPKNP
jgi:hypothetical protein